MKVLLASGNIHKFSEFQELFSNSPIELIRPDKNIEVDETGESYLENAHIKAKAYYDYYQIPVLSDDSGLSVEALPALLGLKSARFAPELENQGEKNKKLLSLLEEEKNRLAYFTCQLCLYMNPREIFFFEGILRGHIATIISGRKGFGYDPLFRGEGRRSTLADDIEWKNENSHRAKAVSELVKFVKMQGVT